MTFETALKLHAELDASSRQDEMLQKLWDSLISSAIRYARLRTDWQLTSAEERVAMDEQRTRAHNTFIDDCNILSRAMVKQGLSVDWRATLGQDRKEIGDFACFVHCIAGLAAR